MSWRTGNARGGWGTRNPGEMAADGRRGAIWNQTTSGAQTEARWGQGCSRLTGGSRRGVHFDLLPDADLRLPPALLQVVEAPDGTERLSAKQRLTKRFRCSKTSSFLGRPPQQRRASSRHARHRIGTTRGERCRLHFGRWSGGLTRCLWQVVGS